MISKVFAALAIAVVGISTVACSGNSNSESSGQYIDSSAITTKVKAKLAGDDVMNAYNINVETFKDDVQLSGFVDNSADKMRAEQIAGNVDGVDDVINNISVK